MEPQESSDPIGEDIQASSDIEDIQVSPNIVDPISVRLLFCLFLYLWGDF